MLDLLLRKGLPGFSVSAPRELAIGRVSPILLGFKMLVFGPFNGSIPHYSEMKFFGALNHIQALLPYVCRLI